MRTICLIAHDIRSTHNVGSLIRTADGLGIQEIYFTGYTPYPLSIKDDRLPYLANKIARQINKTSLGAEHSVKWQRVSDIIIVARLLRSQGFTIAALEQTSQSVPLISYRPADKVALIVGNEVNGLDDSTLACTDTALTIPMLGRKESFNVAQAAAMGLFYLRYCDYAKL